jgi:hypothetical protein
MLHKEPEAKVEHPDAAVKLGSEVVTEPMVRTELLVFDRTTDCCVAVDPGASSKFNTVGLIAIPGSTSP